MNLREIIDTVFFAIPRHPLATWFAVAAGVTCYRAYPIHGVTQAVFVAGLCFVGYVLFAGSQWGFAQGAVVIAFIWFSCGLLFQSKGVNAAKQQEEKSGLEQLWGQAKWLAGSWIVFAVALWYLLGAGPSPAPEPAGVESSIPVESPGLRALIDLGLLRGNESPLAFAVAMLMGVALLRTSSPASFPIAALGSTVVFSTGAFLERTKSDVLTYLVFAAFLIGSIGMIWSGHGSSNAQAAKPNALSRSGIQLQTKLLLASWGIFLVVLWYLRKSFAFAL